jgi:hypothetical protein
METGDKQTIPVSHHDGGVRGIVQVSEPEIQLTELLEEIGVSFFEESQFPGVFNSKHWISQWCGVINLNLGYMWLLVLSGKPIGAIGIMVAPDLNDAALCAQESFWYVMPNHRGGMGGMRLKKTVEKFCMSHGIKRLFMGRNHKADPEGKLAGFYEKDGYFPTDTLYCKVLHYDT